MARNEQIYGDIIQTSSYIDVDLNDESLVPDYEGFVSSVAEAFNSVSRKKYSSETFVAVIGNLMDRYAIPHFEAPQDASFYNDRAMTLKMK